MLFRIFFYNLIHIPDHVFNSAVHRGWNIQIGHRIIYISNYDPCILFFQTSDPVHHLYPVCLKHLIIPLFQRFYDLKDEKRITGH